eukprot:2281070-Prymnesium_polylepis.1
MGQNVRCLAACTVCCLHMPTLKTRAVASEMCCAHRRHEQRHAFAALLQLSSAPVASLCAHTLLCGQFVPYHVESCESRNGGSKAVMSKLITVKTM